MATVTLGPEGRTAPVDPTSRLPRRLRLSRGAVEHLADLAGAELPWRHPRRASPAARALNVRPPQAGPPPGSEPDPADEVARLGLTGSDGGLQPEVAAALAVLGAPEVIVDLDLSVRRGAGYAQLRSWQRLRGDRVASLSTCGGAVELGWCGDDLWQVELARAVTVDPTPSGAAAPAAVVDLPHELLLGSGEALRLGRPDVLAELLRRHGTVRIDGVRIDGVRDGAPPGPALVGEQVRLLHAGALGRLRAVVAGVGSAGTRRAGWVSWLLFADGWRALTPHVEDGQPRVRVHAVEPMRLGAEVARLVAGVRT